MTINEWIAENKDFFKTRDKLIEAGIKALNCRRDSIQKCLNKQEIQIKQSARKHGCLSLETFRNKFDKSLIIPQKIDEGIETYLRLADGKPGYMTDHEFRERLGVSNNIWRRFANEYDHLQVRVDGTIYWGHPDIIDQMKEITLR